MLKLQFSISLLICLISVSSFALALPDKADAKEWLMHQPLRFTENNGQLTDTKNQPIPFVLFKASSPGMDVYLTTEGLTYVYVQKNGGNQIELTREELAKNPDSIQKIPVETAWVKMLLKGASIKKENIQKEGESGEHFNFFYAHCPSGIYNVHEYQKITIKNIYPGIDWVIYGLQGKGLKYDFIVHPGANPEKIKLLYEGENAATLDALGNLNLKTSLGTLQEQAPYSYIASTLHEVKSKYSLKQLNKNNVEVSFEFSDPSVFSEADLVIDPNLTWGTFYGGSTGYEYVTSITTDPSGNVYITGETSSSDFPTQAGIGTSSGAYYDGTFTSFRKIFIAKFTANGVREWVSFIGGNNGQDVSWSICSDLCGNIYVTGTIWSSGFPMQSGTGPFAGAYFNNSTGSVFLMRFNSGGVREWTTKFGGNAFAAGDCITTDPSGNIYLAGYTYSCVFPTAATGAFTGAYTDGSFNGGQYDQFYARFTNKGVLEWSTLFGGSGDDLENLITVGPTGNLYATGYTTSSNFPLQTGTGAFLGAYYDGTFSGNINYGNAFVLRFSTSGKLEWSTFFGNASNGSSSSGKSIISDATGNIYVLGNSSAATFPSQPGIGPFTGAYLDATPNGGGDIFILRFNTSGILEWATLYGGSNADNPLSLDNMAVGINGNLYVSFETLSNDVPTKASGCGSYFDATYDGSYYNIFYDQFLLEFSNAGVLSQATYVGAEGNDQDCPIAMDACDNLYMTGVWRGVTNSAAYPIKNPGNGAYYDSTYNSGGFGSGSDYDTFIFKLSSCTSCTFSVSPCSIVFSAVISSNGISCNGQCVGTATVNATNGTTPYSYVWNNGKTKQALSGLCAGSYTVVITDATSASIKYNVVITQPAVLSATLTSAVLNCYGICNGTLTVNASGGTVPYKFAWSNGATLKSPSALCAGNYSVNVTDANSCSVSAATFIIQPAAISTTITASTSTCGQTLGAAQVMVSGGTPLYSYLWSNAKTTDLITGLNSANYQVTITDSKGCTKTDNIQITNFPGANIQVLSSDSLTCFGSCDGSILLGGTGGTAPYSFVWNGGQTGDSMSGLCSGIYSVTLTDIGGCTASTSISVNQPSPITALFNSSDAHCGQADGLAVISASGGSGNYFYTWSNGASTSSATGLLAGTYTVIISDANGCTFYQTVVIADLNGGSAQLNSVTDVSCNGFCNGSINTSGNGTPPFIYLWSNGATTAQVNGLCAQTYSLLITDNNGCTSVLSQVITELAALAISLSTYSLICNNNNSGLITSSVSGGTAPYAYFWSNGKISTLVSALSFGSYTLIVTDINSCSSAVSAFVNQPAPLTATLIASNTTCGQSNGSAEAFVSGGNSFYSFSWSNGETSSKIVNLSAQTIQISVTDINGCSTSASIQISNGSVVNVVLLSSQSVTCSGENTGSIAIAANAGVPPYSFQWSNGGSTSSVTGLTSQIYSVTVTDNTGCISASSFTINEPPLLSMLLTSADLTCNGSGDGTAGAIANGGTPGYSFFWSTGKTINTLNNLVFGVYGCTVTDANACSSKGTAGVNQPALISVTIASADVSCFGTSTGSASANVSGGTMPYNYLWSTASTNQQINNAPIGNYSVMITDANGCTSSTWTMINQPAVMSLTFSATSANCGASNGSANANATGGTPVYNYQWSNGSTTSSIYNLTQAIYNCAVTDANGCITTGSITVTGTLPLILTASGDTTITKGESAILTANASGSSAIVYTWAPSTSLSCVSCVNPIATPASTTTYYINISDNNGCTATDSVTIKVEVKCEELFIPNAFSPNNDGENDVLCLYGTACMASLNWVIYDRWGEPVFRSSDISFCWNGNYNGGVLETGVYVYHLEGKFKDGNSVSLKGNITLLK